LYSIRSKLLPESKSSTTVVLSGSLADCSAVLDVKNQNEIQHKITRKSSVSNPDSTGSVGSDEDKPKRFQCRTKEKY
jgi:hypothetical protein